MTIVEKLNELAGDITPLGSAVDGAVTLLNGQTALIVALRAEVADLGASAEILAKIDELKAGFEAKTTVLATAVAANTEAPPAEPPVVE